MNAHVAPGRYNAYICHAGCFDWTSMFAGDAYTWFAKEIGADYWADMAKVHSQSPHAFAATMQTPTLVIHGALDYRVPDGQGLAYYNTLKARGVDALYASYWSAYRIDFLARGRIAASFCRTSCESPVIAA